MVVDERLLIARASYDAFAWTDAHAAFVAVDQDDPLAAEDLERLAIAAHLLGRVDESDAAGSRAHLEAIRTGDVARAARTALWVGMGLMERGEVTRGSGWLARASRVIDEAGYDGPERGYLLIPHALRQVAEGDVAGALVTYDSVLAIAERFAEPDLLALGRMERGRALIAGSDPVHGLPLLDDAMISLTSGEVSPLVVGIVYCSVIETCRQIFDLRRAQEWTAALSRWCDAQPDLVAYRGQCLIYRAELMLLHGDWDDAAGEAERARDRLLRPPPEPAVGQAIYQLAELERLRGDFVAAEASYREASSWGRGVEPGLPLLRLAQGDVETAAHSITRALAEAPDALTRAPLLAGKVEIDLVSGDLEAARAAADELRALAELLDAPLLWAMEQHRDGLVRLAGGDTKGAIALLRKAWASWREIDVPYEAARVRVAIGRACRTLGDSEGANLEFDAALRTFMALGAMPDAASLEREMAQDRPKRPAGLSPREVEILRLVAAGRTNREIANDLTISERTVDRHVSNIYGKIEVSTRAAATAFAYEQGLTG